MNKKLSILMNFQVLLLVMLVFSKAHAITSLTDNFDSETAMLNYAGFANWDVNNGTVDTVATGTFSIACSGGSAICVDLDGSTSDSGILSTKEKFDVGVYILSFDISGNQRGMADDTVEVIFGDYSETFTLASNAPWQTITRNVEVTNSMLDGTLSFENEGGDNFGIILDNVSVGVVPIPAAAWLFGSALLGLVGYSRKRSKA